jgi:(1->4)-alpha-D-glucan 1-alpha-D-glucosylmutase
VQAKGLEDTAFYRYNVLLSLNEVGGDPSRFGRTAEEFHDANASRAATWPFEMLATATHDTKVGEDVRARIDVLSELPDEWSRQVSRWMRINKAYHTIVDGEPAPDRADEYRFYQALVGVWPPDVPADATQAPAELVDRLCEYMLKAVREAKVHTSWLTTNQPYEDALAQFVRRALSGPGAGRLLSALLPFQARVASLGVLNSLAQTTLKLGSPGVPDIYQGTELWDLSLVDPDNRRPVDFAHRSRLLDDVDALLARDPRDRTAVISQWLNEWKDGRIKLLVTAAGLRLRKELPHVFTGGRYLPLATEITVPAAAVAFARTAHAADGTSDAVVFAVPRLCHALIDAASPAPLGADCWKTSRILIPPSLADRTYRHELTGAEVRPTRAGDTAWFFVGELFATAPVGILRAV